MQVKPNSNVDIFRFPIEMGNKAKIHAIWLRTLNMLTVGRRPIEMKTALLIFNLFLIKMRIQRLCVF